MIKKTHLSGLKGFVVLLFFIYFSSCKESNQKRFFIPKSKLPAVQIKIKRYGQALFQADTSNFLSELQRLQKKFPLFLNGDLKNRKNYLKLYNYVTDTQIIHIYHKTMELYPNLTNLEKQLANAFAHIKYYFPKFKIPHVYSYISDINFEQPVIIADSVIIIALDDYLGENFPIYPSLNIPRYKRRCMKQENIVPDIMKTMYMVDFKSVKHTTTLLDKMIEQGKQLWFLDITMPDLPDTLKICYTAKQLSWINKHKEDVWATLVANRLLFTSDFKAIRELTDDAPFTKGFGNNSAPKVATWLGWQIVSAYMQRFHKTTPEHLFEITDSQMILKKSRYKP